MKEKENKVSLARWLEILEVEGGFWCVNT